MFLLSRSAVMVLPAAERALTAAKPQRAVGQDCCCGPLSSHSCMGVSQGCSPHLWLFLALLHLGGQGERAALGAPQPGCAVVEGAELALLHSAPPPWLGLARCCGISCVGADTLPHILISPRERSCLRFMHQSHTLFYGLSEESPAKIR